MVVGSGLGIDGEQQACFSPGICLYVAGRFPLVQTSVLCRSLLYTPVSACTLPAPVP